MRIGGLKINHMICYIRLLLCFWAKTQVSCKHLSTLCKVCALYLQNVVLLQGWFEAKKSHILEQGGFISPDGFSYSGNLDLFWWSTIGWLRNVFHSQQTDSEEGHSCTVGQGDRYMTRWKGTKKQMKVLEYVNLDFRVGIHKLPLQLMTGDLKRCS